MKKFLPLLCLLGLGSLKSQNGFQYHEQNLSIPNPGLNNRSCLIADNAGNKWIGFNNGSTSSAALLKYDGTTWTSFAANLPSKKVNALTWDETTNVLWIGTEAGLCSYDGQNFTTYSTANSTIPVNAIKSLSISAGVLWIGTNAGIIKKTGSSFVSYTQSNSSIPNDSITCVTATADGGAWIGFKYGLGRMTSSGNFTFSQPGSAVKVNMIYMHSPSEMFVATTPGGIYRYASNQWINALAQLPVCVQANYPTAGATFVGKGPSGGWCFNSQTEGYIPVTKLVEVLNGVVKTYAFPNTQCYSAAKLVTFDAATNLFYFSLKTPSSSFSKVLYSFDPTQYDDFGTLHEDNFKFLDINQMNVGIANRGVNCYDSELHKSYYSIKTNSSRKPGTLFSSSLWMGGLDGDNNLRFAGSTYHPFEGDFAPGPLDTVNTTADSSLSKLYDKVWKINRVDIQAFISNWNLGNVQNGSYVPDASILEWPAHGTGNATRDLAPFVDVNGNGIYDPMTGGDYPAIKGDQMLWTVYNDVLSPHQETNGLPLYVEIHASAYAYNCNQLGQDERVLNYTTYFHYEIFNRSKNNYANTRLGIWHDSEVGYYLDDYVGCDVNRNMGFTYNADAYDDTLMGLTYYPTAFAHHLPFFSCQVLHGPKAPLNDGLDNNHNGIVDEQNEECLMSGFTSYSNNANEMNGNPIPGATQQYYNLLNNKWKNGEAWTYGGMGTDSTNPVTNYLFPGITTGEADWTEVNASNIPYDRRMLLNVGPFVFPSHTKVELEYSLAISIDSLNGFQNNVGAFSQMLSDNDKIKEWYENQSNPSCTGVNPVGTQEMIGHGEKLMLFPNPISASILTLVSEWSDGALQVDVLDLTGRQVFSSSVWSEGGKASLQLPALGNGCYMVRVQSVEGISQAMLIKM